MVGPIGCAPRQRESYVHGAFRAALRRDLRSPIVATTSLITDTGRMVQRSFAELEEGLPEVRRSPVDNGAVRLIVRRPAPDERELVGAADLDTEQGLVGDTWLSRGSKATADGAADRRAQVTLMNARAAALIAGPSEDWAAAGDQLYVDLDLGEANLPAGTRLAVGTAVLEVSPTPHTGCAKFSARFGVDAMRIVNAPEGRALRLRGMNATVVTSGSVRLGDPVRKI